MEFKYEFEGIYVLAAVSFVVIMLTSLFDRKLNKSEILDFVDNNINDYEFRQDVVELAKPRVGEVVENVSSPWYGMLGYVTRINEDYTYNLYEMYEDSLELGNDEPSLIISLLNKYDDYEDKEIFMYIFNATINLLPIII